ncbi:MAG: hypothetical protein HOV94_23910 [Saccharothrix sp.]|nr:hypothetical protein [Saccharothrix sp.]
MITAGRLNAFKDAFAFLLNPPLCELIQNATGQTIPNNAWTPIAFADGGASIQSDTYGGFSASANTRYTAQVTGWYTVAGVVSFNANAVGGRGTHIYRNGVAVKGHGTLLPPVNGGISSVPTPTRDVFLTAGQYVELYGFQSSGAGLGTFIAADHTSSLYVRWSHA